MRGASGLVGSMKGGSLKGFLKRVPVVGTIISAGLMINAAMDAWKTGNLRGLITSAMGLAGGALG